MTDHNFLMTITPVLFGNNAFGQPAAQKR